MNDDGDQGGGKKPGDPFDFFKLAPGNDNKGGNKKPKIPFWGVLLIMLGVVLLINVLFMNKPADLINFSDFRQMIADGRIRAVDLGDTYFTGYQSRPSAPQGTAPLSFLFQNTQSRDFYRTTGVLTESFLNFLDTNRVDYKFVVKNSTILPFLVNLIVPFGIMFLMYFFLAKRMGGGLSGSIFGPGGSKASAVDEGQVKTRFSDVAGVDEAKEELVEVVDFLKSPKKYTDIGGKIPKGVLLVGPPGTGKTLLARAVAGEAGVPFFRISGSDFVEMFVGVGASRVRDLFKNARAKAPCIVFIDEIDAIGKSRVNSINSNDEREQTLNQLLVEMDGFDNASGLIILAATNRPDVLDHALLRPGRFDRQILVDPPDLKGREAILKIHAKNVKTGSDVDLGAVARMTSGFSGADLANIVNEAALLAVRSGRKLVAKLDFDEAIEKIVAGLQKKTRVLKPEERKLTAYHEAGHALVAAFTPSADPVQKISIIPRGHALGYTMQMPVEDRYTVTKTDLLGKVDVLLGGRIGEEMVSGEYSTGAASDLTKATDIVRKMITDYGMSEKFRNVALTKRGGGYLGDYQEPQLVREYSESTQTYIDEQIAKTIEERYAYVASMLGEKRVLLDYISQRLLEKETIDEAEFLEIVKAESSLAGRTE
jgi:cell division protease FtsH